MSDTGTPPVLPTEFQQYNSYLTDPLWQRTFSITWASITAAFIVLSLPYLILSIRNGRAFAGFFGVSETWNAYVPIEQKQEKQQDKHRARRRTVASIVETISSFTLWTIPGLTLNLGQIVLIMAYMCLVVICIVMQAPLVENPNRAGFMVLALLPPTILLSTKNSILSLLLGPGNGYEKLNFLHRASGRLLFLSAVIHGSLWIRNHLYWGIPILGPQKETSGVAALGVLCIVVLSSLKPVRRYSYQTFYIIHQIAFPAFFITICYHTVYAPPWIFPPLAFYGADVLLRLMRVRIKDAGLVDVQGRGEMTMIRVKNCDAGWEAGQHVRARIFFGGRMFESHPLTIMNASSASISCLDTESSNTAADTYNHEPGTLLLAARVSGDWTKALNEYVQSEQKEEKNEEVPVQIMISGPYGGSSIDLGEYERVLLFAGGSGATFTIGLLDELVSRVVLNGRKNGEKTRVVRFVWCIRGFGAIDWFAPLLSRIAHVASRAGSTISVQMEVYVTCLCNPELVPDIPNCTVRVHRPAVYDVLNATAGFNTPAEDLESKSKEAESLSEVEDLDPLTGGGLGVCVSGPAELTREASNAVAKIGLVHGLKMGGVGLHTELFDL